jgi:pimeloyl-ACP methyl ester carboxylesterase
LVHGGGSGGWTWAKLAPLLRSAGHEVYTPTLTGLGERSHLLSPEIDLETHIADVVGVLKYEGLGNVILAGHSYGGMVITGAADRAAERVGHLVYLDAAIPKNGECLIDVMTDLMEMARKQARTIDDTEVVLGPDSDVVRMMSAKDPDIVAWKARRQRPHPWKCFSQPLVLRNEAAMRRIPVTKINCTPTLRKRDPESLARAVEGERAWEIDTTHDLMVTEPQKTAEMLLKIAAL